MTTKITRVAIEDDTAYEMICATRNLRNQVQAFLTPTRKMKEDHGIITIYNPLEYAWEVHKDYIEKFARTTPKTLLVGMNPGRDGMTQNGIPFGDYEFVTKWMKLEGRVFQPQNQNEVCQVHGLYYSKHEDSGRRLWTLIRGMFGDPEEFFSKFFVINYCPLIFLTESGACPLKQLWSEIRVTQLKNYCDEYVKSVVKSLEAKKIIAMGRFVEDRLKELFNENQIVYLTHPSTQANGNYYDWLKKASQDLQPLIDEKLWPKIR